MEVDAVCDGETVLIPGIMEHVERAGVHSGDSMAIYPGVTLTEDEVDTIVDYTTRIGRALEVRGLMNIQYVVVGDGSPYRSPSAAADNGTGGSTEIYVIEVNPRSSRTIPFISKVTGVPMVRLAVKAMLGRTLKEEGYEGGLWKRQKLVAVKAPVFSMSKLTGVDTYLGPEMKSTGEVMGIDTEFTPAVAKALMAAGLASQARRLGAAQHSRPRQGGVGPDDARPQRGRLHDVLHGGHGRHDCWPRSACDTLYLSGCRSGTPTWSTSSRTGPCRQWSTR